MTGTITFNRETLDQFKTKLNEAKENKSETFVWKGTPNNVKRAETLVEKLEASPNLSIPNF